MRIKRLLPVVLLGAVLDAAFAQESEPPASGVDETQEVAPAIPVDAGQSQDDAAPGGATQLDEIVVTAERRVQSLQATPISIEAFNAEKLEQRGIQGLADLSSQVSNMTIEPFPTHNATLRIFIRGVGLADAQLTQDPAVSVYVDGVYIARSVGLALDIADLERIEVLRGPQGTLYGRNTTGGAINLITKRPDAGAFTMTHKLLAGERNTLLGKSSLNVPLGDTLAFKLALLGSQRDGFVENLGPGGDFGDREEQALRFDTRWHALDWLTADYSYEYTDMKYFNYMFQAISRPNTNKGQAELFKPYAESQTLYSEDRLESYSSGPPFERSGTRINGHALTLTAPIGGYEIKYIGAYRDLIDREYADLGGGKGSLDYRLDSNRYDGPAATEANGGPTPLVVPTVTQDQISHELQLTGSLFQNSVQFVTGVFQFSEKAVEDRRPLNHQISTFVDPQQLDAATQNLPPDQRAAILALAGPHLVNLVDFWWSIDNRALATFGQVTWTPLLLDERLHLTLGYRRSDDEREAVKFRVSDTYIEGDRNGEGSAELLSRGERFDYVRGVKRYTDDSFSYVAAFDLNPRVNLYVKSAEAYKSGGFNIRDPNVSADSPNNTYGFGFVEGFAPEYIQSYELGIKSEWWDRRLRLNADVFNSRYRDMQTNFLIPGTITDTKSRNAGKARMRGLELDATVLLLPDVTLSADYAYLDADVLEVLDSAGNNVAHLYPFPFAPKNSYIAALDWNVLKGGWADLRAFLSYNYTGRRGGLVITEERRGLTSIPAYGLFNARLTVGGFQLGERGAAELALWGRNLADKQYPAMAIDNLPQADRAVVWGEPRTLGLDLTYRYY